MTDTSTSGAMQVDTDLVRKLAELLDSTHLTEIEVQDGDRRIRVARTVTMSAAPTHYAPVAASASPASPAAAEQPKTPPAVDNSHAIKSPMVGTAYLSPEPGAPTFVSVGAKVSAGATLRIIEAM